MVAIIIGTHGNFSEELVRSSEMIFGKQSNVSYITFKQGEGLEELAAKYNVAMDQLYTDDGVLFMVDLFGGSPYNAASMIALKNENMDVVTGVNLPMLLETFESMSFSTVKELKDVAITAGLASIKSLKDTKGNNL